MSAHDWEKPFNGCLSPYHECPLSTLAEGFRHVPMIFNIFTEQPSQPLMHTLSEQDRIILTLLCEAAHHLHTNITNPHGVTDNHQANHYFSSRQVEVYLEELVTEDLSRTLGWSVIFVPYYHMNKESPSPLNDPLRVVLGICPADIQQLGSFKQNLEKASYFINYLEKHLKRRVDLKDLQNFMEPSLHASVGASLQTRSIFAIKEGIEARQGIRDICHKQKSVGQYVSFHQRHISFPLTNLVQHIAPGLLHLRTEEKTPAMDELQKILPLMRLPMISHRNAHQTDYFLNGILKRRQQKYPYESEAGRRYISRCIWTNICVEVGLKSPYIGTICAEVLELPPFLKLGTTTSEIQASVNSLIARGFAPFAVSAERVNDFLKLDLLDVMEALILSGAGSRSQIGTLVEFKSLDNSLWIEEKSFEAANLTESGNYYAQQMWLLNKSGERRPDIYMFSRASCLTGILDVKHVLSWKFDPVLVTYTGSPGSGKSTAIKNISETFARPQIKKVATETAKFRQHPETEHQDLCQIRFSDEIAELATKDPEKAALNKMLATDYRVAYERLQLKSSTGRFQQISLTTLNNTAGVSGSNQVISKLYEHFKGDALTLMAQLERRCIIPMPLRPDMMMESIDGYPSYDAAFLANRMKIASALQVSCNADNVGIHVRSGVVAAVSATISLVMAKVKDKAPFIAKDNRVALRMIEHQLMLAWERNAQHVLSTRKIAAHLYTQQNAKELVLLRDQHLDAARIHGCEYNRIYTEIEEKGEQLSEEDQQTLLQAYKAFAHSMMNYHACLQVRCNELPLTTRDLVVLMDEDSYISDEDLVTAMAMNVQQFASDNLVRVAKGLITALRSLKARKNALGPKRDHNDKARECLTKTWNGGTELLTIEEFCRQVLDNSIKFCFRENQPEVTMTDKYSAVTDWPLGESIADPFIIWLDSASEEELRDAFQLRRKLMEYMARVIIKWVNKDESAGRLSEEDILESMVELDMKAKKAGGKHSGEGAFRVYRRINKIPFFHLEFDLSLLCQIASLREIFQHAVTSLIPMNTMCPTPFPLPQGRAEIATVWFGRAPSTATVTVPHLSSSLDLKSDYQRAIKKMMLAAFSSHSYENRDGTDDQHLKNVPLTIFREEQFLTAYSGYIPWNAPHRWKKLVERQERTCQINEELRHQDLLTEMNVADFEKPNANIYPFDYCNDRRPIITPVLVPRPVREMISFSIDEADETRNMETDYSQANISLSSQVQAMRMEHSQTSQQRRLFCNSPSSDGNNSD